MNSYKELVSALREEAEAVKAVEWDIPICTSNHIAEAADVIEHLCTDVERLEAETRAKEQYIAETISKVIKERDDWKTLGSLANKRAEDYREMRRQRDKAIKERDAAIADLRYQSACWNCTKNGKDCHANMPMEQPNVMCGDFEWRGVQEVEHEETPT